MQLRIASPIGIASLGAEGLYQVGKFTKKRIGELKAMTPEQRQELKEVKGQDKLLILLWQQVVVFLN